MNALLTETVRCLDLVLVKGRAFDSEQLAHRLDNSDAPLNQVRFLCYQTLRWYSQLKYLCDLLITKPLKAKDKEIELLLITSLCRLLYSDTPAYAVVSDAVEGVKKSKKPWAAPLINGCLRNFIRQQDKLMRQMEQSPEAKFAHPKWWIEKLRQQWPEQWQAILEANNSRAPMFIRVNRNSIQTDEYQTRLALANTASEKVAGLSACLRLSKPCAATELPGFDLGLCSVQDAGAQFAAELLAPVPGESILDACAAPGGKAAHLLELCANQLELICLDADQQRHQSLTEQLRRLQLTATTLHASALKPEEWWSQRPFDRILLDAPCSGSGVIRRHADIKHLRRPTDLANFAQQQKKLLDSVWPLLKRGGQLLYCTCSIFHEEGESLMNEFLKDSTNAEIIPIETQHWGIKQKLGRYILPTKEGMDGFYYARLKKN